MSNEILIMLLLATAIIGVMIIYKKFLQTRTENEKLRNISPEEANFLVQQNRDNPNFVILDVRTQKEFAEEHLENGIQLDFNSPALRDDLSKLDRDKIYVTHCKSGRRSTNTLKMMKELGFKEAYNMEGGIDKWRAKGLPTVK